MIDEAIAMLRGGPLAERVRFDQSIASFCTYRVGGNAAAFVEVEAIEDLVELAVVAHRSGVPTMVIGKGSNLLVSDAGFAGIALTLGDRFAEVTIEGTTVRAGAAAAMPVVARATVQAGLAGFVWAVGVPGSIGGGVRMNAGGHGSDIAASLVRATIVDLSTGDAGDWTAADLAFDYRTSALSDQQVVVEATLELAEGDADAGADELSEIVRWRRENQPGGQNAGSVFTNPEGDSAGRLIDASGCKGLRVGTAMVSTKHANFIQADRDGRADDVRALMLEVQRRVEADQGVRLVPETRMFGFEPRA